MQDFDSDADVRVLDSSDPPKKQPLQPPPPPSHSIFSDDEDAAAAGPSKAGGNALLAALEGQFECTICREFMVAAHSLVPCGHMFCGECVGEWILKKSSCPTCRSCLPLYPYLGQHADASYYGFFQSPLQQHDDMETISFLVKIAKCSRNLSMDAASAMVSLPHPGCWLSLKQISHGSPSAQLYPSESLKQLPSHCLRLSF